MGFFVHPGHPCICQLEEGRCLNLLCIAFKHQKGLPYPSQVSFSAHIQRIICLILPQKCMKPATLAMVCATAMRTKTQPRTSKSKKRVVTRMQRKARQMLR